MKTYLGDGLYVQSNGYQIRLFTDRGAEGVHEVFLGISELSSFMRFLGCPKELIIKVMQMAEQVVG